MRIDVQMLMNVQMLVNVQILVNVQTLIGVQMSECANVQMMKLPGILDRILLIFKFSKF
jgi:hypothetical protein